MIRLIGYFFGIGVMLALLVAAAVGVYIGTSDQGPAGLRGARQLRAAGNDARPRSDGALMAEFARERRLYLPIQAIPDRVKAAFLRPKTRISTSIPASTSPASPAPSSTNFQNLGSGRRPVGASTITQQVAKNFLLSSDQTIDRKIKEVILSFRIEQAYSKDRILELYSTRSSSASVPMASPARR